MKKLLKRIKRKLPLYLLDKRYFIINLRLIYLSILIWYYKTSNRIVNYFFKFDTSKQEVHK